MTVSNGPMDMTNDYGVLSGSFSFYLSTTFMESIVKHHYHVSTMQRIS